MTISSFNEPEEDFEIYCSVCGSCGEDGCCPDWKCQHTGNCLYPEIPDRFIYKVLRKLAKVLPYDVVNWLYNFPQEFYYFFMENVVCRVLGHNYFNNPHYCLRCYKLK